MHMSVKGRNEKDDKELGHTVLNLLIDPVVIMMWKLHRINNWEAAIQATLTFYRCC